MSSRLSVGITVALATVILLLVGAQLLLPGFAAQGIRDRLSANGRGIRVSVAAFPAVELLWGNADRVDVTMSSYRAAPPRVGSDLARGGGVESLHVTVGTLDSGVVVLHDVAMTKRGDLLTGTGEVTEAALRAAIPFLASVTPLGSSGGVVSLEGTTTALPLVGRVSATVDLGTRNGQVVLTAGGLLGSVLPSLTVWSNPRVAVTGLAGRPVPGGLELAAAARLR